MNKALKILLGGRGEQRIKDFVKIQFFFFIFFCGGGGGQVGGGGWVGGSR